MAESFEDKNKHDTVPESAEKPLEELSAEELTAQGWVQLEPTESLAGFNHPITKELVEITRKEDGSKWVNHRPEEDSGIVRPDVPGEVVKILDHTTGAPEPEERAPASAEPRPETTENRFETMTNEVFLSVNPKDLNDEEAEPYKKALGTRQLINKQEIAKKTAEPQESGRLSLNIREASGVGQEQQNSNVNEDSEARKRLEELYKEGGNEFYAGAGISESGKINAPLSPETGRNEFIAGEGFPAPETSKEPVITPEQAWRYLSEKNFLDEKPNKQAEIFKTATEGESLPGRELLQERDALVQERLKADKMVIVSGKDRKEAELRVYAKQLENIQREERIDARRLLYSRLSEKQRKAFTVQEGERKGKMNDEFEGYIKEKIKNLGVTESAFYRLANDGYLVESVKHRFWGGVVIEKLAPDGSRLQESYGRKQKGSFVAWANKLGKDEKGKDIEAQKITNAKLTEGVKRLAYERKVSTDQIVGEAVKDYNGKKEMEKVRQEVAGVQQQLGEKIKDNAELKEINERLEKEAAKNIKLIEKNEKLKKVKAKKGATTRKTSTRRKKVTPKKTVKKPTPKRKAKVKKNK